MLRYIHFGILIFFILQYEPALCQGAFGKDAYISAAYRSGYVIPEYSLFHFLLEDNVTSLGVKFSKKTSGTNGWASLYHYPEWGVALQYSTLGNHQIFGHSVSIYPFASLSLIRMNRLTFHLQMGLGLGYANKTYHTQLNPYNVVIGSRANLHFNAEVYAQYQLLDRFYLYNGFAMDHISNGNLAEPNIGINWLTYNAGIRYRIGAESVPEIREREKHQPTTRYLILVTGGTKHIRSLQASSFFTSSLSFEVKRKQWRVFYPGIGVDLFYDAGTEKEIDGFSDDPFRSVDAFKTGIHLSQELVYNKFSIALHEGFYVGLRDRILNRSVYHRFVIRHQIGDRLFGHLAMKSHFVVLDYIEIGLGYYIKP